MYLSKNYILNVIRTDKKAVERNYEFMLNFEFSESDQNQMDESYEMTALIEKAIEELSPQRKTIFYLKTAKSLTNLEISNKLNISVNTVKVQYYHILKEIREYMSKNMVSSAILISALFW
ncbi:MAG: sigma-70 family RNA polymerase sigma factor [Bacteroidales bacterium]|nr:sigma-70 family RNA polymerase sigma factor [Bacteroidales bacterium]